jgi:nucleotide-binding universal stress UspA family protein
MVVADDWQGRGVGLLLLRALARRAREEGIDRFEAPVLANNIEAVRVLERLGETTARRAGRELVLTIELPSEQPPASWRSMLHEFAAGAFEPARTVAERLWPRRPGSPDDPRYNVIVVGTDGTAHAQLAVEKAGELAVASGARVEVVGAHRFLAGDQAEIAAAVSTAAHALRRRGVAVGEHLRRGDPGLALTDVATEQSARLIVVGAGERGGAARRLVGSVADVVAERSPCNVLIVRPPREG